MIIEFSEPPIQSLMDYVFENCCEFEDFCEIAGQPVGIEECVECHRNSYFPGGSPTYECDNFKGIYVIRYLARQFEQNDFVIRKHILGKIEGKVDLSAVSLGGGPAPEAMALMDGLSSVGGEYTLFFNNFDSEESWDKIYRDICCQFSNYINNIKLKLGFIHGDANSYTPEKQYDIVFISWLFSEMRGQNISNILQVASNLLKTQGYILIMDYHESSLVEEISSLVNVTQDLTLLEHESDHKFHSIVNFPKDIKNTFGPDLACEFAYWVIQRSLDDIPF